MRFSTLSLLVLSVFFVGLSSVQGEEAVSSLENGFRTPPDAIRPSVYWYWINDNVSEEGIVRDLEAMKEVGLGRAFIGNIGEQQGRYGTVKLLSEEWWKATHVALKKATELGIDIGMFNSPGWSQSGGPWVKPEQSMRYLAFSETRVIGPLKFDDLLVSPGEHFQDVKTIAFKSPKDDGIIKDFEVDIKTGTLDLDMGAETVVRSLILKTTVPVKGRLEILVKQGDAEFRSVKSVSFDRSNPSPNVGFIPFAPMVISIPSTKARVFQLKFSDIHGGGKLKVVFRTAPQVESYAEKTLAKMWPTPLPMWDAYMWPEQPAVDEPDTLVSRDGVLDLSKNLRPDGTLQWDVPEGEWIIQRIGMLTTGVQNGPASPEAKGLEIDKMSKEHAAFHFDAFIGKVLERIPEADRRSLKVVVQDSYETGGQNWTDGFIEEFKKRYGYDPVPFLPAINGRVVGNPELSDRFLWDLRRLVADKVAYDYVGGLRETSNKHGLTTWLECYGHWGFPGEFLQYGGQSDGIAGEFWNEGSLGSIENRAASSCGHIYGKTKITAESFTAGGGVYERYPRLLKKRCDWSYTEGINDTLLHLYIHQPYEDKTPGVNAWFATEFNRKNTWFFHMKPFVEYMRRCMFLLQQGQNVADVAYFIGEDAPKMTGVCDPPLPKGYSFDYINGETIREKLSVKDGRLVLPHGTSYRLLVLPNQWTMRPEVLRKIKTLVEQGACILGPAPNRSPSLQDYPRCDEDVRKLADGLWGEHEKTGLVYRKVGKGTVAYGMDVQGVLDRLSVAADCVTDNPNTLYVHRSLEDGTDVYFLSNQVDSPIEFAATFRTEGRIPEFWDAVDGTCRSLPAFQCTNGLTKVPLRLEPWGSVFIVFRQKGEPSSNALTANFPERKTIAVLEGPWKVCFESDALKRGPKEPQRFEKLMDWTASEEEAVKYYSGKATYETTFDLKDTSGHKSISIDIGDVRVVASVKVNGRDAGMLWTAPWRLDVTSLVKSGKNTLEIEVVNTWINRLVGDMKLPEPERKTWLMVNPFKPNGKLAPSGLLGPVQVLAD